MVSFETIDIGSLKIILRAQEQRKKNVNWDNVQIFLNVEIFFAQ
jgi:hypothetical protein